MEEEEEEDDDDVKRGSTELKKAGKGSNGVAINKSHTPPGY